MSDWEDEPSQKPVVEEAWESNQGNTKSNDDQWGDDNGDDGGWGNGPLTWAQEDTGDKPDISRCRFDDDEGNIWGGGSDNRQNNFNSNNRGRGRGGRGHSFNDRRNDDRNRNNEVGFGYDSAGYKDYNGYASKKFFSGNLGNNSGSTNSNSFNNQSDGHYQNSGGKGCYKCGEFGHMARNCGSGGDTRAGGGDGCFKCGEDGHFARECTNSSSGFQSRGRVGGGGYIPKEEDDFDVLYQNHISTGINFDRYVSIPPIK